MSRQRLNQLKEAVETHGHDGAWYLRAYFDDGTPLGSHVNDECRFDSIVQSWAVISEAADPVRAKQGMDAVMEHLVKPKEHLILLFKPPFDQGPLQPGYIKGYIPGVRENGGQYTHAATWVVKALAMLGRGDSAYEVFNILNPVGCADTPEAVQRYGGEPYVIAADVYSRAPNVGRAGWTWYTGSSAWLYRVGLEDILGFDRRGDKLFLHPCLPSYWPEVTITWRFGRSIYKIRIDNATGSHAGTRKIKLDGTQIEGNGVPISDAGGEHEIVVEMGTT